MLKTLARILLDRHGGRYGHHPYKPWKKGKKRKGWGRYYDAYRDHRYGYDDRPYGNDPRHAPPPYGYHRPRGLKGMILDAILRRLLRR
jgi:hypothetical protein